MTSILMKAYNKHVQSENTIQFRREVLKRISLGISSILLSPEIIFANSQVSSLSKISEEEFLSFQNFVGLVIPGAEIHSSFLLLQMQDDIFGFKKYVKFFLKSLNDFSLNKFGNSFSELEVDQKQQIISEGMGKGIVKRQVYHGAIYILQIIVFSGLCEEDQSCDLIDFPGIKRGEFQTFLWKIHNLSDNQLSNGNPK